MDEFKRQGGSLGGREERTDSFNGEPRSVGSTLGGAGARGTTSLTENETSRTGHHSGNHMHSTGATTGTGVSGSGVGNSAHGTSGTSSTTAGKPSLMNKLNPKTDSDGDGKAGFMK